MIPALRAAVTALGRPGGVVLYPTETLYGIGGRASDGLASERIAALKGRPVGGLLVLTLDPVLPWAIARRLADAFWPGPLSIVVPGWDALDPSVLGPDGTVGVRIPVHPVARALVEAVGPISSTSANRSGAPPIRDVSACPFAVDAVLDAGPLPPSPGSTVVHGETGRILREGAIPAAAVARVLAPPG